MKQGNNNDEAQRARQRGSQRSKGTEKKKNRRAVRGR